MSILFRSEAVASYAAQVRAELAGLDPELLDDLTEGLEADLTEALVDTQPPTSPASPTRRPVLGSVHQSPMPPSLLTPPA